MMGVRIFNCSWDGTEFDASLKNTMEKYSDALFVCSGGKMMNDLEVRPVYPACYALPNVIAVMAIDQKLMLPPLALTYMGLCRMGILHLQVEHPLQQLL